MRDFVMPWNRTAWIRRLCDRPVGDPPKHSAEELTRVCVDDKICRRSHDPATITTDASATFPNSVLCPITHAMMLDPVLLADGYSYERAAILKWLANHTTSPATGKELRHLCITPNHALRTTISELVTESRSGSRRRRFRILHLTK